MARLFFTTLLRGIYADKTIAEAAVRGSGLEWTLVNPVRLTSDAAVGKYKVGERIDGASGKAISRATVAAFMLKCVGDLGTVGRRMIIAP